MGENMSGDCITEDQLQELRLRYCELWNIVDVTDHFFRHLVGLLLVNELIRVSVGIYTAIELTSCSRQNILYRLRNFLIITGVLIPSAYLHHSVSINFLPWAECSIALLPNYVWSNLLIYWPHWNSTSMEYMFSQNGAYGDILKFILHSNITASERAMTPVPTCLSEWELYLSYQNLTSDSYIWLDI